MANSGVKYENIINLLVLQTLLCCFRHCRLQLDHSPVLLQALSSATGPLCCYYRHCHLQLDHCVVITSIVICNWTIVLLLQALASATGPLCCYYRHCHLQLDHCVVITGIVICNWTIVLLLQALSSATGPLCCYYRHCHLQLDHCAVITGIVICNWTIVLCVLLITWCTFDSAGRSWVKMKHYQDNMHTHTRKHSTEHTQHGRQMDGGRRRSWRQRYVVTGDR